eukprot:Awhi_evm1s13689
MEVFSRYLVLFIFEVTPYFYNKQETKSDREGLLRFCVVSFSQTTLAVLGLNLNEARLVKSGTSPFVLK